MTEVVIDGRLNPSLFREGQRSEKPKLSVRIFEDGDDTYVGKTATGLSGSTSLTIWQIMKITELGTGSDTVITYADGNEFFDNIWDNLSTLNYS